MDGIDARFELKLRAKATSAAEWRKGGHIQREISHSWRQDLA